MREILRQDDICVVSLADNNYAQHLGVTFTSLLKNLPPDIGVQLYVISSGLTEENRVKLERTVEHDRVQIHFIIVDGTPYEGFDYIGDHSRETYLRLAIPDVIPSSIHKIICIDSDVVVTDNIVELWEVELRGHAVAAVIDNWAASRCKSLNIPEGVYFNAGIMVINLSKWRDESIGKKAIDYISQHTHKLVFHEQDALNALLFDDWIRLPTTWNAHTTIIKEWSHSAPPSAIHYTGLSKPWHFDNIHPYKQEYYKYLRMTEWKSYKPEINVRRIIKRLTRPMMPILEQILPRSILSVLHRLKTIYLS